MKNDRRVQAEKMKSQRYPNLFSPIKIKNKTFKNRIMVSPMGLDEPYHEGEAGVMSEEAIFFYRQIAAGGAGRICTGESDVVYGSAVSGHYSFFMEEMPPLLVKRIHEYAAACHEYGALAFCSFNHMGVYARTSAGRSGRSPILPGKPDEEKGGPPPAVPLYKKDGTQYTLPEKAYGPSELIINEPYDGVTSRLLEMDNDNGKHIFEMDEKMMNEIADAFARCAANAQKCGLDGMVIHAGHGFLFSQWVSRRFNKRTDEFGGSMENRARFPIMCLKRIREAVGDDFLIEMRFSAEENISPVCEEDFIPETVTIEEAAAFFREIDKYPGLLDIAHITGGLHTVPVYNIRTTANSCFPMALNVKGAAAVKAAVKNIKVGVVGSLSDPDLCEEIIAQGKADFVILCRQLLFSDPEFPKKAEEDRPEDIDNCLRCVICHENDHCAVNPDTIMLGAEDPLALKKQEKRKKIAVIGGGIAGMKAAEYAAKSGHMVTLYEQSDSMGGILNYTEYDELKPDVRRFKNNMVKRLRSNLAVSIRMSVKAEADEIKKGGYDAVIVATGGKQIQLPLPGADRDLVMDAAAAYTNPGRVGEHVVVIGGGLTGCEAAIHWASLGRKVTLVSRSPALMKNVRPRRPADGSPDTHLMLIHRYRIDVRKGCACRAITDDGVYIAAAAGDVFVPADSVINATGIRTDPEGVNAFAGCAPYVKAIGDVASVGMIGDAVLSAREAVVEFNSLQ